ncbi:MAG TPA: tetratricopeptide repeat-containing protein kinase family protein, partial [Nannocystis sp.]
EGSHDVAGPEPSEFSDTTTVDSSTQATQQSSDPSAIDRSNVLHWVRLTQVGNVLGTPAYMSPEQHFGRPAGPASDQFSFSITLYEALYGSRPFGGDSWAAIRRQVQEGVVPPPPLESKVPRRVFKAIQRGLEVDPERRWPSMAAMIEALEHDPWRMPLRVAAMAGLIAAASLTSYTLAMSQVEGGQRCKVDAEHLAGVWDAARESAVTRAFEGTHLPFAADAARHVRTRLDAYAAAWVAERKAACEDRASGAQTDRLADLRVACLDRRKAHLAALVDAFVAADRSVVENAVQAAAALPSLAACADTGDLLAAAPPDDPAVVASITQLRADLDRADVSDRTGRYEEGLALITKVRAGAAEVGYAPLDAEAALVEGRLLMNLARGADAEAVLLHAAQIGIAHDLHAIAAEAATIRMYVLAHLAARPQEALATAPFAEALVRRVGDDTRLQVLLHNNIGAIHHARDDFEAARAEYERALKVLADRDVTDPFEAIVHNNLGLTYLARNQLEQARSHFARSAELFVALVGEQHPSLAHPIHALGDVEVRRGRPFEAMPHYQRSLALFEAAYGGAHPYLMFPLVGLGNAHARAEQAGEAAKYYARAVQVAEASGQGGSLLAEALAGLGDLAAADGQTERARELYERAAAAYAEDGDGESGARVALRAGELAAALGDGEAAIRWFEQVVASSSAAEPSRRRASALLALQLGRKGAREERVCELVKAGAGVFAEGDALHTEMAALAATRCGNR